MNVVAAIGGDSGIGAEPAGLDITPPIGLKFWPAQKMRLVVSAGASPWDLWISLSLLLSQFERLRAGQVSNNSKESR